MTFLLSLIIAAPIRILVLLVEDYDAVDRAYTEYVMATAAFVFKRDAHLRIRYRIRSTSKISHEDFRSLDQREEEYEAWKKVVKRQKGYKGWIRYVAVPQYYTTDGCTWSAGYAGAFAFGVIRTHETCIGADRFNCSWIVLAHEVLHVLGASHIDGVPNVMHPAACIYHELGTDLRILPETRKEIRR